MDVVFQYLVDDCVLSVLFVVFLKRQIEEEDSRIYIYIHLENQSQSLRAF